LVLSYPEERAIILKAFLKAIKELKCDVIAGVATGAIPWAAIIADKMNKPMIYVRPSRKEHGKQNQIEGELSPGAKVMIIEDTINSGKSSIAACEAIRQSKGTVTGLVAIFNYRFADNEFRKINVPLYWLSDFQSLCHEAVKQRYINKEERKVMVDWYSNPKSWNS
ncbi:MAG TPA: orotate phosphoribosyltransferase, partial [Candidatus Nanoarchaeia archaeon]|nr:orotate phosphoribosyltransferase [Candidatus Nanoarchaeia archaeon]